MHCTAPPAVPLVRLSIAATATSRPRVGIHGDLQVHGVGPERGGRGAARRLRAAGARTARRRRPSRRPRTTSAADAVGGAPCSGEDAARHRGEDRGEATRRPSLPATTDRFWTISGVCRCTPPTPYGARRTHHLGAQQVRLGRLARAGRAGHGVDDDLGLGQAGGERGEERERRRRRVAAGDGDPRGRRAGRRAPRAARAGRRATRRRGAAVPALPGAGVGEPVVGAAVDHEHVVAELRGQLGGAGRAAGRGRRRRGRRASPGWSRRAPGRPAAAGAAGARRAVVPALPPAVSAPISDLGVRRAAAGAAHPPHTRSLPPPRSARV